jgi:hypothetical protein
LIHSGIVQTFVRMSEALTGFALKRSSFSALAPFLLHESGATSLALISACVMLARAQKTVPRGVQLVTDVSVSVADASTADRDVFDGVIVPSGDGGILRLDLHHLG